MSEKRDTVVVELTREGAKAIERQFSYLAAFADALKTERYAVLADVRDTLRAALSDTTREEG